MFTRFCYHKNNIHIWENVREHLDLLYVNFSGKNIFDKNDHLYKH